MIRGAATTTITCSPDVVFDVITDVSRMGEWSPECTGGRWIAPAQGPAVGAEFDGDNIAKLGPITLKKWTTTSEVVACTPGEIFEFVSAGYTKWRFELVEIDGSTRVTETFEHEPYEGLQKFLYQTVAKRTPAMIKGMESTLAAMKEIIEADPRCSA